MTQLGRNNSAVSETLGYIILFGIVTLSMGIIYVVGYPVLQSNIDANVFESAEQNFVVLQSNMKRVSFDQAPVKTLKIKLHGSEISASDHSSIRITIDNGTSTPHDYTMGEIRFSKGKKSIIYEMGSVIKSYTASSMVMVSKPPIYTSTMNGQDLTTISVVSTNGNAWLSGRGITTITMNHNSTEMLMHETPVNVTVRIDSENAPAWERYLEDAGFNIDYGNTTIVSASRNDTMLIVSNHVVDVMMK